MTPYVRPLYHDPRLGPAAGLDIWLVDGAYVRRELDEEFIAGGHHYRYSFIPKSEIWIDDCLLPKEWGYTIDHEIVERDAMIAGVDYDTAHASASAMELAERRANPSPMKYPYLSLAKVLKYEPMAKALGVSEVARSKRGFLTAYREAGGKAANLSPYWRKRREGFISRHLAQVTYRGEPLWDEDGQPTRRHLALIMWAFSPDRKSI